MPKTPKLLAAAGLIALLSACAEYREKRAPCASLEVTGQIVPCHAPRKINLASLRRFVNLELVNLEQHGGKRQW